MDPALANFLGSLKSAGLSDSQIGDLAKVQNSPSQWNSMYASMTGKKSSSSDDDDAQEAQRRIASATKSSILNLLRMYGLDDLDRFVDRWVRDGLSEAEIEAQLYDPKSSAGKVVDSIYPELRKRAEKGLRFMSISQIQEHIQAVQQIGRQLGIPENYYSRAAITKQLGEDDVSAVEFKDRAEEYASLGLEELDRDPQKRQELEAFQRYYKVKLKPGEIAGMVFDTDLTLPTLRKRINAVRLDVAAGRASFGDLSLAEAERLSDVGVDANEAIQGFGQLAEGQELFGALDAGEDTISREEQLGAVFEGNAQAQRRIQQRARRRVSQFEGGGSFAGDREGFSGVGSAR